MALTKMAMQTIIIQNGHLRLTGEETAQELRDALIALREHTSSVCQRPMLGIPIEELIPNVSVVSPAAPVRKRRAVTVDMSDEYV